MTIAELLYADNVVVHRLAANQMSDLNAGRALGLYHLRSALSVFLADIAAGNNGDEAGVFFAHAAGQTIGGLGDVGAGRCV